MLKFPLYSVFLALLAASLLHGQNTVQRPRLLGLAHVAFRVSDVDKTRAFYKGFLGYEEPFSLKDDEGKTTIAFMKVNDLQFVELFQGDAGNRGQLDHFALYTDDLTAMRAYLVAKGVYIFKDIHQGRVGNSFLNIRDPDGRVAHPLERIWGAHG